MARPGSCTRSATTARTTPWRLKAQKQLRARTRTRFAVILTAPGSRLHQTAQQDFASVEPLPDWKLTVLDAHEKGKRFYLVRGFRLDRTKF